MKIAVLADIHGNLPALRAVLADVDAEAPDALVVAGDIVAGPLVRESLKAIDPRPEPTYWISGNSERDAVRVYDGEPASDDPPGRAAAWSAAAIGERWRDQLASWPISLALDGVHARRRTGRAPWPIGCREPLQLLRCCPRSWARRERRLTATS